MVPTVTSARPDAPAAAPPADFAALLAKKKMYASIYGPIEPEDMGRVLNAILAKAPPGSQTFAFIYKGKGYIGGPYATEKEALKAGNRLYDHLEGKPPRPGVVTAMGAGAMGA